MTTKPLSTNDLEEPENLLTCGTSSQVSENLLTCATSSQVSNWQSYLRGYCEVSPRTITAYTAHVRRMLDDVGRPEDLDFQALVGHFRRLATATSERRRPYSTATRAQAVSAVKSFCFYLSIAGVLPANPARHLRVPRIYRARRSVLTRGELIKLLGSPRVVPIDPVELRDRAMINLIFWCGLRSGEIAGIEVGDVESVDDDSAVLQLVLRHTKWAPEDQVLALEDTTAKLLTTYLRRGRPQLKGEVALFPAVRTGKGIGPDTVRKIFTEHVRRAEIRPRGRQLSPHCLRHTLASMLIQTPDWTLEDVRIHMRHQSAQTTHSYLHTTPRRTAALLNRRHPLRTPGRRTTLDRLEGTLRALHEQQSLFQS